MTLSESPRRLRQSAKASWGELDQPIQVRMQAQRSIVRPLPSYKEN